MKDETNTAVDPRPASGEVFDATRLRELADEGLRLRRDLDDKIARMKTITAPDLQLRSR